MALTRANATTAISGTIAASSVANATVADISALPSGIQGGALTLLSTQTASASASIEFTSGIDSTYDSYVFKFIDIHPSVSAAKLEINFSTDSGSNYNVTKTTTFFQAYHYENGSATNLQYSSGNDLAQSTSNQPIVSGIDDDNDSSASGSVIFFNPSSTTFVKHFITECNTVFPDTPNLCVQQRTAGYGNTTSAINAVRFQISSGNFDGIIKMYGVS